MDISRLWSQLEQAKGDLAIKEANERERIKKAIKLYELLSPSCSERLRLAKTTWLIPLIVEGPGRFPLPAQVEEYAVIAVDSSHIPPDRHSPVGCFLINLGLAILEYGSHPDALLESLPKLFYKSEDLVLREQGGLREMPVKGAILDAIRSIEELLFLAENLHRLPTGIPLIALWDGSLILWELAGQVFPRFVVKALLEDRFVPLLEKIRNANIPLAGYISFPRSTEVINLLRLILCPHHPVDCDNCSGRERPCKELEYIEDRELFREVLREGERSPLFISRSVVLENYHGNDIYFFYLRVGEEVSRVELPVWAIGRVDLVHSLIYSQVLKGGGYPVALMEAHQQAFLSQAERSWFRSLISQLSPAPPSPKRISKQIPWV